MLCAVALKGSGGVWRATLAEISQTTADVKDVVCCCSHDACIRPDHAFEDIVEAILEQHAQFAAQMVNDALITYMDAAAEMYANLRNIMSMDLCRILLRLGSDGVGKQLWAIMTH